MDLALPPRWKKELNREGEPGVRAGSSGAANRGSGGASPSQCDCIVYRARLASIASGAGTRTRQARPKNSMTRITHQLRSNCHHFRPCLADVGKAWWLLCHPSPIASTPKIVLL